MANLGILYLDKLNHQEINPIQPKGRLPMLKKKLVELILEDLYRIVYIQSRQQL